MKTTLRVGGLMLMVLAAATNAVHASITVRVVNEKGNGISWKGGDYDYLTNGAPMCDLQVHRSPPPIPPRVLDVSYAYYSSAPKTDLSNHPGDTRIVEVGHVDSGENLVDLTQNPRGYHLATDQTMTFNTSRSGLYCVTVSMTRQIYEASDQYDQMVWWDTASDRPLGDPLLWQSADMNGQPTFRNSGNYGYTGGGTGVDHEKGVYRLAFVYFIDDPKTATPERVWGTARLVKVRLRQQRRFEYQVYGSIMTHVAEGESDLAVVPLICDDDNKLREAAAAKARTLMIAGSSVLDEAKLSSVSATGYQFDSTRFVVKTGWTATKTAAFETAQLGNVSKGAMKAAGSIVGIGMNVIFYAFSEQTDKDKVSFVVGTSLTLIAYGLGAGGPVGAAVVIAGNLVVEGVFWVLAEEDQQRLSDALAPGIADDLYVAITETYRYNNQDWCRIRIHNMGEPIQEVCMGYRFPGDPPVPRMDYGGVLSYPLPTYLSGCCTYGIQVRSDIPYPLSRLDYLGIHATVAFPSGAKAWKIWIPASACHWDGELPDDIMPAQPAMNEHLGISLNPPAVPPMFKWFCVGEFDGNAFEVQFARSAAFAPVEHSFAGFATGSNEGQFLPTRAQWEELARKFDGVRVNWRVRGRMLDGTVTNSAGRVFDFIALRAGAQPSSVIGFEKVRLVTESWSSQPLKDITWTYEVSPDPVCIRGLWEPEIVPANFLVYSPSTPQLTCTVFDSTGGMAQASFSIPVTSAGSSDWLCSDFIPYIYAGTDVGTPPEVLPSYNDSTMWPIGLPDVDGVRDGQCRVYRHWFTANPLAESVKLWFASDDGCDIYANGVKVGHYGGQWGRAGSVNCAWNSPNEELNTEVTIPSADLLNGQNLIAAVVYNSGGMSYFDLTVTTTPFPTNPVSIPPAPTGVAAVGGDNFVRLTWNAVSGNILKYNVYRNSDPGGTPQYLGYAAAPLTNVVDYSALNNHLYYYWLTSVKSTGEESEYSSRVAAMPKEAAPDPYFIPPALLEMYTRPAVPTEDEDVYICCALDLADGGGSRGCHMKWWIRNGNWPWEQGSMWMEPVSGNRIWQTPDHMPHFGTGTQVFYQVLPLSANGNGSWSPTNNYVVGGGAPDLDPLEDWDNDGYPAAIDQDDDDAFVNPDAVEIPNGKDDDGDGRVDEHFDSPMPLYTLGPATVLKDDNVVAVAAADMNGDGLKELVIVGEDWIWVLDSALNTIAQREHNWNLTDSTRVLLRDMNADGRREIIVADGSQLYVLNMDANCSTMYAFSGCDSEKKFGVGDVTGDGRLDMVYVDGNEIKVYECTGSSFTLHDSYRWYDDLAGYFDNRDEWAYVQIGSIGSLAVVDLDADVNGSHRNGKCEIAYTFSLQSPMPWISPKGDAFNNSRARIFAGIVLLEGDSGDRLRIQYDTGADRLRGAPYYTYQWVCDSYELVGVADFDNDGVQEAACEYTYEQADGGTTSLKFYGAGLSVAQTYAYDGYDAFCVGHFRRDCRRAIALRDARNITVFDSSNTTAFASFQALYSGNGMCGYDFNHDGVADFLLWNGGSKNIEIWDGASLTKKYTGTVKNSIEADTPNAVVATDLEDDGLGELVFVGNGEAVLYRQVRGGVKLLSDRSGLTMMAPVLADIAVSSSLVVPYNSVQKPVFFAAADASQDAQSYTLACRVVNQSNVTVLADATGTWKHWAGTQYVAGATFSATGQQVRAYWAMNSLPTAGVYSVVCDVKSGTNVIDSCSSLLAVSRAALTISSPTTPTQCVGQVDIQWKTTNTLGSVGIFIYARLNSGGEWKPIILDAYDDGQFRWNTLSVADGTYEIKVTAQQLGTEVASASVQSIAIANYHADEDHDGIPDGWEREHFGNLGTATATSDYDGDGMPDWAEAVADTDPKDAESNLRLLSVRRTATGYELTWQGGRNCTQYLDQATTLAPTPDWLAIATNTPPTPITNLFDNTGVPTGSRFFRIRVTGR